MYKKWLRIIPILALGLLFFSCEDFLTPPEKTDDETYPEYEGLEQRNFWAQDMRNYSAYQTRAARLYEGEKCVIWGELSSRVALSTAEAIAREYDTNIASSIVGIFGDEEIYDKVDGEDVLIGNSLDYADYLTDGDGKLTILLLDIRDGYTNNNDSYTAGYFTAVNFYRQQDYHYSNETDMMYVDTYPAEPGSPQSNSTFAHELQHLINYVNSCKLRSWPMDIWIDEGLSVSAEYIYLGGHPEMRYKWFIYDQVETISRGNNFFVWDNHDEPNAVMDEYATAYLFFQWLRLQSGGDYGIYHAIAKSMYSDKTAVVQAANTLFVGNDKQYAANWETLLKTWMAANYINSSSGIYGYKNEPELNTVRVWAIGGTSQSLYPGEGVYSITRSNSASPTGGGEHIKYGGLAKNGTTDFTGSSYFGERLLTFNMNDDPKDGTETGPLTGARAEQKLAILAASRQAWEAPKSLPIDARDISKSFRQEEQTLFRRFVSEVKNAAK